MSIKDTQWSIPTKRLVAVGLILAGILIIYISRSVVSFLVMAVILAYLLDPVVSFLSSRLHVPRWSAVIMAYVLLLISIVLLPAILTPAVIGAIQDIDIDMLLVLADWSDWLQQVLQDVRHLQILQFRLNLSPIVDPALDVLTGVATETNTPSLSQVLSSLPSALEIATGLASTVVGTVLAAVLAFVITLIFSIYISLDLPDVWQSFLNLIPPVYRSEYARLGEQIRLVWDAYFRGELLLMLIIGSTTAIGNLILGVPGAIALGVVAGLLEVLPNIGPILASIPAILLALIQGSSVLPVSNLVFALIVIVFYILVQQVENNLIVPRVIGNAIEVHPVLVMAGVIVGASVGGLLGAILAAPLLATGRIIGHFIHSKMAGLPPFLPRDKSSWEVRLPGDETPSSGITTSTGSAYDPATATPVLDFESGESSNGTSVDPDVESHQATPFARSEVKLQQDFSHELSTHWRRFLKGAGSLESTNQGLRFVTTSTTSRLYSDAQIDDYQGLSRREFLWKPPLKLTVKARFSHSTGDLAGTAGFGFWNDPFLMTGSRFPTLPRAIWFFYSSPPSNLKLDREAMGWGWKAATIDATQLPALAWAPLTPIVVPLMNLPPIYTHLWPHIQRALKVNEVLIEAPMTEWHTYTIEWGVKESCFGVDGRPVLKSVPSPRGRMGFVMWLDNQYMVATPQGRFAWGRLDTPGKQWMEVEYLSIE